MEFGAEIREDGSIDLKRCNILIRQVTKIDVFPLVPGESEPEAVLLVPHMQTLCVKMPVAIPQGKSLLVALPGMMREAERESGGFLGFGKKITREKVLICVMITPKVIDPDEVRFKETNRQLDVAIDGEGFFRVVDPYSGEILYTRQGNFSVAPDGHLIRWSEHPGNLTLRLVDPPIKIPVDVMSALINEDGTVWITQGDSRQLQHIGCFMLSTFDNPAGLLPFEDHLFLQTDASGPPTDGIPGKDGMGTLKQSMLEQPKEPVAKKALGTKKEGSAK